RLSTVDARARSCSLLSCLFFFNDTPSTEIYTLSLHDALPISPRRRQLPRARDRRRADSPHEGRRGDGARVHQRVSSSRHAPRRRDRKSTRLNSSHLVISYAVFCLKKKKSYTNFTHPFLSAPAV